VPADFRGGWSFAAVPPRPKCGDRYREVLSHFLSRHERVKGFAHEPRVTKHLTLDEMRREPSRVARARKFNQWAASPYELDEELGTEAWQVDGNQEFFSFWFHLPDDEDWIAVATFQFSAQEPVLRSMTVRPFGEWASRPLTAKALGSVKINEVYRRAHQHLGTPDVAAALGRVPRPKDDFTRVPRPGRRGRSDLSYARWAAHYVKLEGRPKRLQVLARQHKVKEQAARDILYQARRRGLLTTAPPGKAGGELTDKARKVLERGTH
jgi:hypothetical protein